MDEADGIFADSRTWAIKSYSFRTLTGWFFFTISELVRLVVADDH